MSIWNLYAKVYDTINQNIPYLKMISKVINELDLQNEIKILDAGCGTGNILYKIYKKNSTIKIIGIDSSPEMLKIAEKKFFSIDNVRFRKLNLDSKINFSNNYFDRIVSVNSLYALKNSQRCLEEFYRILKPGGKIVIANPDDKIKMKSIFSAQLKELGWYKFIIKFLKNLPEVLVIIFINFFFLRKKDFNYLKEEKIKEMIERESFKIKDIQRTYADQDLLIIAIK